MKTSQESKTLSPRKELAEVRKLLNFARNFADEQGRFPTQEEIPMESYDVIRYFGSYEAMLRAARLGKESFPLRKPGKRRYCRFCNELLLQYRWFFCDDECERKFAERDDKILAEASEEIKRLVVEKPKRRIWHRCKKCKENCKIYLPIPQKEPGAKVICKASPEYEEANKILIKEMEGKQKLVIPKIE